MCAETEHKSPGQAFAWQVKDARNRQRLSQQQLADRVHELGYEGMTRSTLAKIEAGGERAERVRLDRKSVV